MAAGRGKVQVLEKMRDWTKEIRLNPEELRKVVCLLKENSGQRLLHNVAGSGKVELLEELWDWAKKLQLISEKLRKKVCLSKHNSGQTPWHNAPEVATLKY
jgi:hypothetical protein